MRGWGTDPHACTPVVARVTEVAFPIWIEHTPVTIALELDAGRDHRGGSKRMRIELPMHVLEALVERAATAIRTGDDPASTPGERAAGRVTASRDAFRRRGERRKSDAQRALPCPSCKRSHSPWCTAQPGRRGGR